MSVRERVEKLIDPHPESPDWSHGYLDLLGSAGPSSTGPIQSLWLDRFGSAAYDTAIRFAPLTGEYRQARRRLGLAAGELVLDVGCGPGNVTPALATAVGGEGLAIGVDVSAAMLSRAVAAGTPAVYVRADASRLPFGDGTFDVVWSSMALQLLDAPYAAVDSITRVLRPGGRLVLFSTCGDGPPGRLLGLVPGIWNFRPDDLPDALSTRGFTDIRQRVGSVFQSISARLTG